MVVEMAIVSVVTLPIFAGQLVTVGAQDLDCKLELYQVKAWEILDTYVTV